MILFLTFNVIGAPDIVWSSTYPRYVTSECCFIFMSLYLIFSWRILFTLRLLAKRIDFVLSSPNHLQRFSKSSLSRFSIYTTSLRWYRIHESSAYNRRVDTTACGMSLTWIRNNRGPKMDPCLWYPKVRKFVFNIYQKYPSESYDLNHFMVLTENLIALSSCNKISWSVLSNAFYRSINMIPVNKPF